MMTPLTASAHGVQIGSDLLFLDLARDAYVCLAGAAEAVRGPVAGAAALDILQPALTDALQAAGLVGAEPAPRRLAPTASRDLARARPEAQGLAIVRALPMTWISAWRYFRPLGDLLQSAPTGAGAFDPGAEPCATARSVIADFQTRWPWALGRGRCLHRAFVLRSLLRAHGCDAAWVFGVRTYPFEAHCWLQIGVTVLDDPLTQLSAYAPLYVA